MNELATLHSRDCHYIFILTCIPEPFDGAGFALHFLLDLIAILSFSAMTVKTTYWKVVAPAPRLPQTSFYDISRRFWIYSCILQVPPTLDNSLQNTCVIIAGFYPQLLARTPYQPLL